MPPADIPVEASDALAFTPSLLSNADPKPVFMLRAITERDKRHHRRLMREEGLVRHSDEDIREQTRRELKALWSPEDFDIEMPRLETYWSAVDEWALQRKDEPELEFEFDPEEVERIDRLSDRIMRASPDLRRMNADNAEAAELSPVLLVAVTVQNFTGLDAKKQIEGGYLTLNSVYAIRDALGKMDADAGSSASASWVELMVASARRMHLIEEEAKNSESPSPSEPDQQNSSKGSGRSKSRASAKSPPKTSET